MYQCPANAGFSAVRVHDLKHTFGRRLRAAGMHLANRQVLLDPTNGSITTDYSAADLSKLLNEVEKLAHNAEKAPAVTLLRRRGDR
ncbi:phage integrase [Alcaligenes sp. HPC1271]|nr:phage integrase [Alcaligenes sp. HPC1271]